jgi:hypothetical protein
MINFGAEGEANYLYVDFTVIFYNVYSHKKTKKIQCSYESPREEAREEYG